MSMTLELNRRSNFFFSPHANLMFAITYEGCSINSWTIAINRKRVGNYF